MGKVDKKIESGDLISEAVADAKAVRAIALENAKDKLHEIFTPHLKSLLAKQIQKEEDDEYEDEEEIEDEEEVEDIGDKEELEIPEEPVEGDELDLDIEDDEISDEDLGGEEPVEDEELDIDIEDDEQEEPIDDIDGEEDEIEQLEDEEIDIEIDDDLADEDEKELEDIEDDEEEEEELDLESIVKEIEAQLDEEDEELDLDIEDDEEELTGESEEATNDDEEEKEEEEVIETISLEKYNTLEEEAENLRVELDRHKKAIEFLKEKNFESKMIETKLYYVNRILGKSSLSEEKKLKVLELFDKAKNTGELKLIYQTLKESINKTSKKKKRKIAEGLASRSTLSKPRKEKILTEADTTWDRYQFLANIKKEKII